MQLQLSNATPQACCNFCAIVVPRLADSQLLCTLVPSLLAPTSVNTAWLHVHIVAEQIALAPFTDFSVKDAGMLPANILSVFVLLIQAPCAHAGPVGWFELFGRAGTTLHMARASESRGPTGPTCRVCRFFVTHSYNSGSAIELPEVLLPLSVHASPGSISSSTTER